MSDLSFLDAIVLGVVEGLTEFLPISSTGHLTIAENLLGLSVDDPAVTAYTAIIQIGAIAATLLYFWRDILRLARAWVTRTAPGAGARAPGLLPRLGRHRGFPSGHDRRPARAEPHHRAAAQHVGRRLRR